MASDPEHIPPDASGMKAGVAIVTVLGIIVTVGLVCAALWPDTFGWIKTAILKIGD